MTPERRHHFLPGFPTAVARTLHRRTRESPDDEMAVFARGTIDYLCRPAESAPEAGSPEPPFEAVDTSGGPACYNLEIGLGEEVVHSRSNDIDRLVRKLSGQDGVDEALREDREIIPVRAPSWGKDRFQAWAAQRL